MNQFVVYQDMRWRVLAQWLSGDAEDQMMYRLRRVRMGGVLQDCVAPASECPAWKRGTMRHIKGKALHREKRPVHLDIDTGSEIIKARLKGKRTGYTCTFGGLYDLLARQQVINTKRDRAFAKRTGKRRVK